MRSRSKSHCWEIMRCDKSHNCPAGKHPEKNCWDLAREKDDDYRCFFNICRDCIVYVLKKDSSVLSNQEVLDILKARPNCSLACDYGTLPPQCGNVIPLPQR